MSSSTVCATPRYPEQLSAVLAMRPCTGYHVPRMTVIPPGLDFSNLKVDLPQDPFAPVAGSNEISIRGSVSGSNIQISGPLGRGCSPSPGHYAGGTTPKGASTSGVLSSAARWSSGGSALEAYAAASSSLASDFSESGMFEGAFIQDVSLLGNSFEHSSTYLAHK